MSDPIKRLHSAASDTESYIRNLAQTIGEIEAEYGPNSEEYRKARKRWDRAMERLEAVAPEVKGVAHAMKDAKSEFDL